MRLLRAALTSVFLPLLVGVSPASAGDGGFGSDCGGSNFACARVTVPLDYSGRVPGTIPLYVERNGEEAQAVFALAGGPGQGNSTVMESFNRDIPLRSDQALYTFDQRGTGKTGALTCPEIDSPDEEEGIDLRSEACAQRLGASSSLYTTRESVEDLERVRQFVGDDKITIYGVSYGTKVAVSYALEYPQHVESLVLDSVVEPEGQRAFDLDTFAALPRVLREICRGECRGITTDLASDVQVLAERMRTRPLRGRWVDKRGRRRTVSMTARDLYGRLRSGDLDAGVRAAYPAAVRSAIEGDPAPLLRIEHRFDGVADPGDEPVPPEALQTLSYTLFTATICEEAPFPWQRTAAPADRLAQARAAAAAIPDSAFLPFNRETATTLDFSSLLLQCSRWPAAAETPALGPGPLPDVPVLILEGEEDLRTPLEVGQRLATRFPRAVVVSAPKTAHGVVGDRGAPCAATAIRRFFAGRAPGDPCRSFRRAVKVAPKLPARLADVKPVSGAGGPPGRTAAAVVATLEDFYREYNALSFATERPAGGGLRGGRWSTRGPRARLSKLSLVPGVTVTATFPSLDVPAGTLTIGGSQAARGTLTLSRKGVLSGRLGGREVRARFRIPSAPE